MNSSETTIVLSTYFLAVAKALTPTTGTAKPSAIVEDTLIKDCQKIINSDGKFYPIMLPLCKSACQLLVPP